MVKQFAGSTAIKRSTARRLARKIQGDITLGQCILLDFEGSTASPEFLKALLAAALPTKVRICGQPPEQRELVNSRQKETP